MTYTDVLAPIFLGLTLGFVGRNILKTPAQVAIFANALNSLALKVLLPWFVIESFLGVTFSPTILVATGIGFLLPLATLFFLGLLKHQRLLGNRLPSHFDDLRFASSTFGGGSRGTALLVLLFSSSSEFQNYMRWFVLVDLGNFLCLLTAISFLVRRRYGEKDAKEKSLFNGLFKNYAFIAFSIAGIYFMVRSYAPSIDLVLLETVKVRKYLFSAFVFCAIAMQFRVSKTSSLVVDASLMMAGRIAAALLLVPIHWIFPLSTELVVATGILLLMPPSSMLPAMISNVGASTTTNSYINSLIGATNLFYIFLVALGVVLLFSGP
jgi:hypothetical protein